MSHKDGYVYVLSNKSMPGIVKIGKSRRGGKHRAKEIYTTGVPTPFTIEFEIYTQDCDALELYLHEKLSDVRVSESREFFNLQVYDAIVCVTDAFMEDYNCSIVWNQMRDIEDVFHNMAKNAGVIGMCNIQPSLLIKSILPSIESSLIKKAVEDYISSLPKVSDNG